MGTSKHNPSKTLIIIQCTILLLVCSAIFFIISSAPMTADDFTYSIKTTSFSSFIQATARSYMEVGGRLITWITARLFLMQDGRILWHIVNPIIIILFLLTLSACSKGMQLKNFLTDLKNNKSNISLIVASFMLFIFMDYSMKTQIIYWAVGSIYYLWPNLVMLILISSVLFNKKLHTEKNHIKTLGWTLFSFIAGLSIEVVSAVCTTTLFVALVWNIRKRKKHPKDNSRGIAMFTASFLGSAILYLAPGNFHRLRMAGGIPGGNSLYAYLKHNFISAYGVGILDNYPIFSFAMLLCFLAARKLDWSGSGRKSVMALSISCSLLFLSLGYLDNSFFSPLSQKRFGLFVYIYTLINLLTFVISFVILSIITVKTCKKSESSTPLLLFLITFYSLFVTTALPAEAPRVFSTFIIFFITWLLSMLNLLLNKSRLFPNLIIAIITLSFWMETTIVFKDIRKIHKQRMELISELEPEDKILILPEYNTRFVFAGNYPLEGIPPYLVSDFMKYYSVPEDVLVTTDKPPFEDITTNH